jgi:hypothetical protein
MTTIPAAYRDLPFGKLTAGGDASFLIVDEDPCRNVKALMALPRGRLHRVRVK